MSGANDSMIPVFALVWLGNHQELNFTWTSCTAVWSIRGHPRQGLGVGDVLWELHLSRAQK